MAPESEQLRLLLVDDEPKLTEFLRMVLEVAPQGPRAAASRYLLATTLRELKQ